MISFIIPNHNEPNIDELVKEINWYCPKGEIIVSSDPYGRGKGWALREGLKKATGKVFVFIDGDGDISALEVSKLLPFITDFDIVVGKKEFPKRFKRKVLTILSRVYIKLLFGIGDSQTGLKIFNYRPKWDTDSWAADIEILYKAKLAGKKIKEVPIHAVVTDSKTWKDLWTTLKDSLKIRFSQ